MIDFFDNEGFNKFYLKSAKSPDKEKLLRCFYGEWMEYFGYACKLPYETKSSVKALWKKPNAKKGIKERLLKKGFTASTIDGLFKKFDEWNKIS